MTRGAAFSQVARAGRSADRNRFLPFDRSFIGFRVAAVQSGPDDQIPKASKPLPEGVKPITNSIGLKLVPIPAGKFMMGSPKDEQGRFDNEEQHEVAITKPFYLGMYTVTQAEYEKVMGKKPSWFSATGNGKGQIQGKDTSQFPVETVSWDDAVEFCRKLSELPEEMAARRKYRLPTEAEWEYSCRAGTTTRFHSGDDESGLKTVANYGGSGQPKPVGQFKSNAFGLYDMHGNVWQWCADWFEEDYYKKSPGQNPQGPGAGAFRVVRGGSFINDARCCRSAYRYMPQAFGPRQPRLSCCARAVVCGGCCRCVAGARNFYQSCKVRKDS